MSATADCPVFHILPSLTATAAHNTIGIVVVTTSISARAHRDDPAYPMMRHIKHVYQINLCITYGVLASDRTLSEVQAPSYS